MFLLDKPYISDFLIKTIRENNFPVIASTAAKELITDNTLKLDNRKRCYKLLSKINLYLIIYSNSENAIHWVNKNLHFSKLPEKILFFKDKIKFRELIRDIYPTYFYKGIKLSEIEIIKPDPN